RSPEGSGPAPAAITRTHLGRPARRAVCRVGVRDVPRGRNRLRRCHVPRLRRPRTQPHWRLMVLCCTVPAFWLVLVLFVVRHPDNAARADNAPKEGPRPAEPLPHARVHDLRHIHATTLLLAGVPVHVVAARLGHADPAITLRVYAHVSRSA